MTAKVASPACGGLGMQRSVKSQALALHPGPIVLHSKYQTPARQGRCCLSGTLMLSTILAPEAAVFPLVRSVFRPGKLRSVYLHIQLLSTPSWMQSRHIRHRLTAPKRAAAVAAAAPDSPSHYLGRSCCSFNSATFPALRSNPSGMLQLYIHVAV